MLGRNDEQLRSTHRLAKEELDGFGGVGGMLYRLHANEGRSGLLTGVCRSNELFLASTILTF